MSLKNIKTQRGPITVQRYSEIFFTRRVGYLNAGEHAELGCLIHEVHFVEEDNVGKCNLLHTLHTP